MPWAACSWRRLAAGLGLLLWLTAVFPLHAQPIPHEAYWQRLALLREQATTEPEAVAVALEQLTAVSLPDGRTLPVDHSFLIRELESGDGERAVALFDALLQQQQQWPAPQFAAADQEPLTVILQRPEFQYTTTPPSRLEQWWQDVVDWFWSLVARLLPNRDTPGGRLLGVVTAWLGAALLVFVITRALWNLLGGFVAEARFSPADPEADELLTAEAALARAQQFSDGGDYRTAVRYLYLSALLLLEEHGLLRYDRSRTNREYLRSVAHRPELAHILQDVVDVFDRVWYGFQPLGKSDYDHYVAQVEALKRLR